MAQSSWEHLHWPEGLTLPPSGLASDEPPMESLQHLEAMLTLYESLKVWFAGRDDVFIAANLTVYYSRERIKTREFRSPDVFVVIGAEPRSEPRRSWAVWDEDGKYPDVVVELLSDSTEREDRVRKRLLYEQHWRVPCYVMFDPRDGALTVLELGPEGYQPLSADARGLVPCRPLGLLFGVRDGLPRCFDPQGVLIEYDAERAARERAEAHRERRRADEERRRADEERRRADEEKRRADEEKRRADALAERLRSLGLDPDTL